MITTKEMQEVITTTSENEFVTFKYVIIQRFIDFYSDYRYSFRIMKS